MACAIPEFNLKAVLKNLRPDNLHLSDKYKDTDISLNVTADFTGKSIDDMNGKIRLDSLQMNTPEGNNYFLDNLTITAGQVEGQKEIQVLSSFMTAVIRGDYSYNTIPASILQTVQRYIPSLLTLNENMPVPHNNFKFDIRVNNTEFFQKLFQIPLELKFPASIKGISTTAKRNCALKDIFRLSNIMEPIMIRGYSSAKIRQTGSNVPSEPVC